MKKTFLLISLFFAGTLLLSAQKRAMTTDDGLNLSSLRSAIISPDGQNIIYRVDTLDWKKNKRNGTYYYTSADGQDKYQFLGSAGGSDLKYSPNGTYISLKRSVDKKQQLFLIRTTGGEAVQLTKHKSSIGSYVWAEDESAIFFIASKAKSKAEEKKKKDGYDAYMVDEGPNGQREGSWNNIWKYDFTSKKITPITKGQHRLSNLTLSRDGKKIAFTRRTENRRNQGNLSEIYLFDLQDSTMTQLTDNNAPEGQLAWSPNGNTLAFTAADDKNWELKNEKIWLLDLGSKSVKMVSSAFEGNIGPFVFSNDGQSIFFQGLQKTKGNLYQLALNTGKVVQKTSLEGVMRLYGMNKDQSKVLFSFQTPNQTADLHISSVSNFSPQQLTDLNPILADSLLMASAKVYRWKSKDGLEIEGMLYLPPNYNEGKKYPLLLHIHGGPAGVFTESFRSAYHVWAGLGYVQLCPNVRGSSGYSDALLRGNMNDIGGGDYNDLMTGVDQLIEDGIVDEDKMAVRGWSYGGILGGTTITKTNRFKAASLGAMVSDWTSEYGIGFNFDVRLWYIGGTPWENPDGYRQKSALTNAKNIETPTLLLHGMSDFTDTEPQSMMFFAALKDMGKTVRYIRFPREPHGFREPRHQRVRDLEEIKWIQKYTLGIDWEMVER